MTLLFFSRERILGSHQDGIERIRDSVAFLTAAPKSKEYFESTINQLKISCTKKLVPDGIPLTRCLKLSFCMKMYLID